MRSEPTKVRAAGDRAGSRVESRRGATRKALLRRLSLEPLEARTLMAANMSLPAPLPLPLSPVDIITNGINSSPNRAINDSQPSIAVDKNNPQKLAAVWTHNDTTVNGPQITVQWAYSIDAGQTWSNTGNGFGGNTLSLQSDLATNGPTISYQVASDASIGFDRNDQLYILDKQGVVASGGLFLYKFDFSTSTPVPAAGFTGGGRFGGIGETPVAVYRWNTNDAAVTPTMVIDDNLPSFTDTTSTGQPWVQTDPGAGNVYVAWQSFDTAPANTQNFVPNRIRLAASSDGGLHFTSQYVDSPGGGFFGGGGGGTALPNDVFNGGQKPADSAPQLVVSQGRPADQFGNPAIPGGQVTIVYDDYGTGANVSPNPYNVIWSNRVPDAPIVSSASGSTGSVRDAIKNIASGPDFPVTTTFNANVSITSPTFVLSDLTVNVSLSSGNVSPISITLISPTGQQFTLVRNNTDAAGTAFMNVGVTGANLGAAATNNIEADTIFSDHAARGISGASGAAAPYIGIYRPEGGSLDTAFAGQGQAQLSGQWTLSITVNHSGSGGFLNAWSLNLTSGFHPSTNITSLPSQNGGFGFNGGPSTYVRGAADGTAFPTASAIATQGIGPGVSVASDNTLGAYSPHEGRIYTAFVDRYIFNTNPADNTDIFLAFSDDGGLTWTRDLNQVNDDLAITDGFSGSNGFNAGRPQLQPQVAVDPTTGTVALSWFDTRNDASRSRVATYATYSLDGGQTFSPQVYVNTPQSAVDAITGVTVNVGPVPDSQAGGPFANTLGYGTHQGLALFNGLLYPAWASNLNGGIANQNSTDIRVGNVAIPAGPRVIASTMGPIAPTTAEDGITVFNNLTAPDGTREANGFEVTFDRPIDALSFTAADVQVLFRDTTAANASGGLVPVAKVVPISNPINPSDPNYDSNNPNNAFGFTRFVVYFAPRAGIGTYSYSINPAVRNRIPWSAQLLVSGTPVTASTNVPVTAAASSFAASPITVAGIAGVVKNVTVTASITAPNDSQIALFLLSPSGNFVQLFSGTSGFFRSGNVRSSSVTGADFVNTTFDDSAALSISSGAPPYAGTFSPATPLSVLRGTSPNGTWRLEVENLATGTRTTITNWSLTILPGTIQTVAVPGDGLDQNSNGTFGEATDAYSAPASTSGISFAGPFTRDTLPLIVSGPHLTSWFVPGAPATLPPVGNADAYSTFQNQTLNIAAPGVLGNDTDPAGKLLVPVLVTSTSHGALTLNADGSFKYVPATGFTGTDSFIYVASNSSKVSAGIPVTLTVSPASVVPVANSDTYSTIQATTLTVPANAGLLANDVSPTGKPLTLTVLTTTTNGTLTVNKNGSFTYVPDASLTGSDSFTYSISDGTNTSLPASVTINVAAATGFTSPQILNGTVGSLDVVFDRNIDPTSFTAAQVIQILGPGGPLTLPAGSVKVVPDPSGDPTNPDPDPNHPRTFRISFPTQQVSGSYTVILSSAIHSQNGDALDTNQNAGLSLLEGKPGTNAPVPTTYTSAQVPAAIAPQSTITSTLNVPDNFVIQGLTLQLNINYPKDSDLVATLFSPDNTAITLFSQVGTTGGGANFSNTVFDDGAALSIGNGGPPFFGRYRPQNALGSFNGKLATGTWKLVIQDVGAAAAAGALTSWSLTFSKANPDSGLGEPVADQATASFSIFTASTLNPLSSATFTPVGAAPVVPNIVGTGTGTTPRDGFSGEITSIAVDPSDPSGNTVYVASGSGGIWKTSNFLTNNAGGPTYIPLTDYGPTFSLNIGSIAVFGQNSDPTQSIVIAGTGDANVLANSGNVSVLGSNAQGIGFLISKNGGASWTVLDSSTNVDARGNELPLSSPARDHIFSVNGGTSTFKVVVDPFAPTGDTVIIYAAMSGANGGLWRSIDTGAHWTKVSTDSTEGTSATDVILDLQSATVDALGNRTGYVNTIYAAFDTQGSAGGTPGIYSSPNRGTTFNPIGGVNFTALIRNETAAVVPSPPLNTATTWTPNGPGGRIVLAKPSPVPATTPRAAELNLLYESWLYAAVANADGTFNGLYLTKDSGQTWTKVRTQTVTSIDNSLALPTNDTTQSDYNITNSNHNPRAANYDLSLTIDPTNPNITYLGGSNIGNQSGLIRIDATGIYDTHAVLTFDGSRPGGGVMTSSGGRLQLIDITKFGVPEIATQSGGTFTFDPSAFLFSDIPTGQYLNLQAWPYNPANPPNLSDPFAQSATVYVTDASAFTNDGTGVKWTPFDTILSVSSPTGTSVRRSGRVVIQGTLVTSNLHAAVSYIDPLTGHARLIFGDDAGVYTGVDLGNGTLSQGIGLDASGVNAASATYSRNGNLQIDQYLYGASQPSDLAAQIGQALLYGNSATTGISESNPNIVGNPTQPGYGNPAWNSAPVPSGGTGFTSINAQLGAGVGVATDQQGSGIVYQYVLPGPTGAFTDFFQVSVAGGPFVGRTNGLIQANGGNNFDPQWPLGSFVYTGGVYQGNFTVNPLNGNQVIISSNAGRIFSTINQGVSWSVIGEPAPPAGQTPALDGSYAPALAFGAPDPKAPGGIGNLNNFLYAGTVNGNIFVSTTGGGAPGTAGAWINSTPGPNANGTSGLDSSPVLKIITNPLRGSHEAYAVTEKGVYHTSNSLVPNGWINITGNLFALITPAPFNNPNLASVAAQYLTSIVADWRYVIPDTAGFFVGATHPVLYVSAQSGVYRSIDDGQTWGSFPSASFDNAPLDGGYLPNAHVSDLNTALGNIDPTNGMPLASTLVTDPTDPTGQRKVQATGPDLLLVTTNGRGTFEIRLAPIVFPNTAAQPNILTIDAASVSGTAPDGTPLVTNAQATISGVSEQTAFGNTVLVSLYDYTNPNFPVLIGGYNPALGTDPASNTTIKLGNETDTTGKFSITINPGAFSFNGLKNVKVQATLGSFVNGVLSASSLVQGNLAPLNFTLQSNNLGQPVPPTKPAIELAAGSDSSNGQNITNINTPTIDDATGTTTASVNVALYLVTNGAKAATPIASGTSDQNGFFSLTFPAALKDGVYTVVVTASNKAPFPALPIDSNPLTFTIKTAKPTTAPTLNILAADDTGIKGDGITSNRRPHFVGVADPGSTVQLFSSTNLLTPLATIVANSAGGYTIQLPTSLSNGKITLYSQERDVAGNVGPLSNPFPVTITTVAGDYTGDGIADLSLYHRTNPATWFIQGLSGPSGIAFGVGTTDIPIEADFNGSGVDQLAIYRPSTASWFFGGVPPSGISFGQVNVDIPVPGDYLGTGRAGLAVWRPTTGQWFIGNSTKPVITLGVPGDVPVPGDYDNVGFTELAVYRPSTGQFLVENQNTLATYTVTVGAPNSIPMPGQFDNTAAAQKTEPAVYDPTTGIVTIDVTTGATPVVRTVTLAPNAVPAPHDYDGTGSDEPTVYNATTGTWTIAAPAGIRTVVFGGQPGEVPVAAPYNFRKLPVVGDYSNSGATQLALFRRTEPLQWNVRGAAGLSGFNFGSGSLDIPIQGDFNGDGKTDVSFYRPSTGTWYSTALPIPGVAFGEANVDIPVPADYNGIGISTLGVYRPTTGQFFLGSSPNPVQLGSTGDIPVPGNYDGTGKAELAVFEPGTQPGGGVQWLINGPGGTQTISFGGPGDIPVPGDYAGIGSTQIAVFRPNGALWFVSGGPISFGGPGDIPVPGDYLGIGSTQIAVYRPSTAQLFIGGGPIINYGSGIDIPANAPLVYRSLSGQIGSLSVTSHLDFGSSARSLTSAPLLSTPVTSPSTAPATPVSSPSAANSTATASVVPVVVRHRPHQAAASHHHAHDSALATLGRIGKSRRKP